MMAKFYALRRRLTNKSDGGSGLAGSALGEGEGDQEQGGGGVEGGAGDVDSAADGDAEDVGEEAGADESGDASEAVDGSLELALFGGASHAGEKALRGGPGQSHHVEEGDAEP